MGSSVRRHDDAEGDATERAPDADFERICDKIVALASAYEDSCDFADDFEAAEDDLEGLDDPDDIFISLFLNMVVDADFDDALEAAVPKIMRMNPEFDLMGFLGRLMDESTSILTEPLTEETKVSRMLQLEFIPVEGDLAEIGAFVADEDNQSELAELLLSGGRVPPDTKVLVTPVLIDHVHAATMTPGKIMMVSLAIRDVMTGAKALDTDMIYRLFGQEGHEAEANGTRRTVGQRMLLVGTVVESDVDEDDAGMDFWHDRAESDDSYDFWEIRAAELAGDWMSFGFPVSFPRACGVMAMNRIAFGLLAEASRLGVAVEDGFDEIHVCRCGETMLVEAVHLGRRYGPVDIPLMAAAMDKEWFVNEITELAQKVVHHADTSTMGYVKQTLN